MARKEQPIRALTFEKPDGATAVQFSTRKYQYVLLVHAPARNTRNWGMVPAGWEAVKFGNDRDVLEQRMKLYEPKYECRVVQVQAAPF